jgi:hypothetical protein
LHLAHDHVQGDQQEDDAARNLQRRQGDVKDLQDEFAPDDEQQHDTRRCSHCTNRHLAAKRDVSPGRQRREHDHPFQRADGDQQDREDIDRAETHGLIPLRPATSATA